LHNLLEIEPRALADRMKGPKGKLFLIDCREPWEYELARIEGATLIPMRLIAQSMECIPKDAAVVVYCHNGKRSLSVTGWLRRRGIEAHSLKGGIDRWSLEIDSAIPRY
jgi:sulfur-carrier protein adenylyltransferase/sulfurtransferase